MDKKNYGLTPFCQVQHLTEKLRAVDVLDDPRMIYVVHHHSKGVDCGFLDIDDILGGC